VRALLWALSLGWRGPTQPLTWRARQLRLLLYLCSLGRRGSDSHCGVGHIVLSSDGMIGVGSFCHCGGGQVGYGADLASVRLVGVGSSCH
jgi:hypothetical protein